MVAAARRPPFDRLPRAGLTDLRRIPRGRHYHAFEPAVWRGESTFGWLNRGGGGGTRKFSPQPPQRTCKPCSSGGTGSIARHFGFGQRTRKESITTSDLPLTSAGLTQGLRRKNRRQQPGGSSQQKTNSRRQGRSGRYGHQARPTRWTRLGGHAYARSARSAAHVSRIPVRALSSRSPYSSPTSSTARNAFCGISTLPTIFIRFLPSFCFSRSLRLRVMSPP